MRITVMTIDRRIEPRQPRRFEKKKNTGRVYRVAGFRTPRRLAPLGPG